MSKPRHNLDFDTQSSLAYLPRAMSSVSPDEIKIMKEGLQRLQENVTVGLMRTPPWADEKLKRAFPNIHLRFRFDLNIWQCWVIEKWCAELFDSWVIVHKLVDQTGELSEFTVAQAIVTLHEGDTSRFSNIEEFRRHQQDKADKAKAANDRKVEEGILERVDSLSTKSLNTLVDALIAVQTGETITAHGDDEKFLEHSYAQTQKQELKHEHPAVCLNPGANPLIRKDK
jgi:hypothetical protein